MRNRLVLAIAVPMALLAADKNVGPAQAGNDLVELSGQAVIGREHVKDLLGVDPGFDMIAVEIEFKPKTDEGLTIARDDFTLISRNDGQKSIAMHPSQIAGSGTLVVSSRAPGVAGGIGSPRRGPIWGGLPGTGDRPRRLGGDEDIPAGVADGETRSAITDSKESSPVLDALKAKELAQTKTTQPVSGLLYFTLDGKHKLKDLELMYKSPEGVLTLDFQK
jgi:hypothetical protein